MEQIQSTYKNGIFVSREEKSIPFNQVTFSAHNAYEIYILLRGERRVYVGDRIYDTEGGDALMLRPDMAHRSEGNTPYKGLCIQFTDGFLERYFTPGAKRKMLACFRQDMISLKGQMLEDVQILFSHMEKDEENKALYFPGVLALLCRAMNSDGEECVEKRVSAIASRTIEEYLLENAEQITGLEQVADYFGITREYLCTLFKKQTGMTVVTYLNNVRIQKACRLLSTTDLSVEEIGIRCGFRSQVYFYRLFKKMMNHTPAKYRKLIQKSHRES